MASRILLSDNVSKNLSNYDGYIGYKFSYYMKNLMVWLHDKNDYIPKRCNNYNTGGGPWNPDYKEWYACCCYQTNVLLHIWSMMSECTCKKEKQSMYRKAITKLKQKSKFSGIYLSCMKLG